MANKVYTKRGDEGYTSLLSGKRVHKTDNRIELVGELDELNSFIGLLKSQFIDRPNFLEQIQWNLFNAGAVIINDNNTELKHITESDIQLLEVGMDKMNEELPELKNFILPGGTESVALAHICRTICRRTERSLSKHIENPIIAKYLNRLSDYFFVLARYIGHKENINETKWITKNTLKQ